MMSSGASGLGQPDNLFSAAGKRITRKEIKMKLWIASSTLAFLVFLVFFSRQFPRYNWLFASWLLLNVAMQGTFGVFAAVGRTRSIPDIPIDLIGWVLLGLAILKAYRSSDAVNEVILYGLLAQVFLHAFSVAALQFHPQEGSVRILASNLACFSPLAYMLVRFTFVYSDKLPLIAKLREMACGMRAIGAHGFASGFLT